MATIFQRNKKMSKASVITYNFSLPAVKTCPGAGACAYGSVNVAGLSEAERLLVAKKEAFCFAFLEEMRYPSAAAYRQRMLELSRTDDFVPTINAELAKLRRRHKGAQLAIRIHASGDIYSLDYLLKLYAIAEANEDVLFYAYTKSVRLGQRTVNLRPSNFVLIYSMGGTMDGLINPERDRHSRIFASEAEAIAAGYTPANEDDAQAWSAPTTKIGLVMFGARTNKGNANLGNCAECPLKVKKSA